MSGLSSSQPWLSMLRDALRVVRATGRVALGALLCGWMAWAAADARAEGVCVDDGDPHAQAVLESRYPYTYDWQPAHADDLPAALTPAQPSAHVRALLALSSSLRLWVGTAAAKAGLMAQEVAQLDDDDAADGGMTCEGGQSCAPTQDLLAARSRTTSQPTPPQPTPDGPACVLGDPGCDLPSALLEGGTSSSSLELPWLHLPTARPSFTLRATWPQPTAPPTAGAPYLALLGKRLSDRLDRPPRA